MSSKVAFVGLGVMGYPMAGHLASNGHDVVVYNRTEAKATAWCEQFNGRKAGTPAEAAAERDIVFVCVGNDDDLREVTLSEQGIMKSIPRGATICDHTTTSATVAREVYEFAAGRGVSFIDAPVSGGEAGAVNGQLTIMIGGGEDVVAGVEPVLRSYAKSVTHIGPVGTGQLAKMVNQICIAGVVQGLAEGLDFALRAGLDPAAVIGAISGGAAQSWQMDNRWETMVAGRFDFGFAVDWMRKDLGFALDEAEHNGAALDLTRLVDRFYAEVQSMGGGRWDTSSLIARLNRS